MLIDNGHFQYNNVSLGLFVLAVALLARNMTVLGSISFCLALNYKQMELYHALPFFFYLLGLSIGRKSFGAKISQLIKISLVVILTFCAIWIPFISYGKDS